MKDLMFEKEGAGAFEIAAFGGATLVRDERGRLEIIGGTSVERAEVAAWARADLDDGTGLRWYSWAERAREAGYPRR